jgi:hypothetical protein
LDGRTSLSPTLSKKLMRSAFFSLAIGNFMFKKSIFAAAAMCCLLAGQQAQADPNDYVRTPTVEYGEREIDFKSGIQKNRNGTTDSANSIGFGFTPTTWWFTEIYSKYAKPAGEPNGFDAWEWENRFQLTEPGEYPVDVGFLLEIERPKDRTEGYEITYGPMFQAEWDRVQGNFNAFIQQHVRASTSFQTELLYQLQLKYRNSEQLEWGVQGLGNVGRWNQWNPSGQQEFKVGPALFGKIRTGTKEAIKWNAGLLVGTTNVTAKTTLRLQAEYEF